MSNRSNRSPALDVAFEDDPVARAFAATGPSTYQQIADAYGVTPQAVYLVASSALRKLAHSGEAHEALQTMQSRPASVWEQIAALETAEGLSGRDVERSKRRRAA